MPLTRLYRLGPTRQRIEKGYLVAGPPRAVEAVRTTVDGTPAASGVTVTVPRETSRAVVLDTGWRWLHDRDVRATARDDLTAAATAVAGLASRHGCALLPCAVRPRGESSWEEWTVGDVHSVALLDDVEREVATNLFRAHAPTLIALTGRAGVDGTLDSLGSRRLAQSGDHLATRYLASASHRHLSLVESELRRTTGIRDLRSMDVHPLGPPPTGDTGGSLVVRCIDGQAFAGTVVAHALLVQALAMAARRLVRAGRRQGNVPERFLEHRRTAAVLRGIDARVRAEPPAERRRSEAVRDAGQVSLQNLAMELLDDLTPELGTLEAGFEEFAPVGAWYLALAESRVPRTEGELLARRMPEARDGDVATHIARLVAEPAEHRPQRVLAFSGVAPARFHGLGERWEAKLTEPPPAVARRRSPPRPTGAVDVVRRLAQLPEQDPGEHLAVILEAMTGRDSATAELVPWLGTAQRDLVTQARRRLRPPGNRQVRCVPSDLHWDGKQVRRACGLADDGRVAMLRATVPVVERDAALAAVAGFVDGGDERYRVAVLDVSPFTEKDGGKALAIEVLVLRAGGER